MLSFCILPYRLLSCRKYSVPFIIFTVSVEFAGEGLRRADILRWKDAGGKMLAETLMSGDLKRITGAINYSETDPYKRAEVTGTATIETRKFAPKNRYLPFSQTDVLDKNPNIKQNPGY